MVYNFEKEIINNGNIENFYNDDNFVGYILPNGEIYRCKEHNVFNVNTVLLLDLELLNKNFSDKNRYLSDNTGDKLLQIILNYLNKASYDKIVALDSFIKSNNLSISDLIVQLFGCHLVTRLNKTILTSELNHSVFFNYLLNDFKINTIDKIIYDEDKKAYRYQKGIERNDYLYDEVNKLKESVKKNEIELFYKSR